MRRMRKRMGRPMLPSGELRDQTIYVAMRASERQFLEAEANRNGRSLSDQVMFYLRVAFANGDAWTDFDQLRAHQATAARRVLLDAGWTVQDDNPDYTGEILLAPDTVFSPAGDFTSDAELAKPNTRRIDVTKVNPLIEALFSLANIAGSDRSRFRKALIKALLEQVPKKRGEEEERTSEVERRQPRDRVA
jgi:hypothetical protein